MRVSKRNETKHSIACLSEQQLVIRRELNSYDNYGLGLGFQPSLYCTKRSTCSQRSPDKEFNRKWIVTAKEAPRKKKDFYLIQLSRMQ